MKPGSDFTAIMHTVTRDTGALTKHDVILWGNTKDISKNETLKGLGGIKSFVEKHK
jgi:hypothetical protein